MSITKEIAERIGGEPVRVTLADIMGKIKRIEYHNPPICPHMTVAFVQMENGFVSVGTSCPADPKTFDAELGQAFARESAIANIWPLEGYLLRDHLHFLETSLTLPTEATE
ncbi:Phage protein (N4 Gp49/phage Sf6 gene 66) family [uncultured Caudovirales phage]|uniref:Phage protein (N4 Gp49/phage Sf6 gene 66) family n=1 Tax=uncultured Caudovirales phage TaxID=2100421 RepID=A0A6J7WQK7_9CAUD|nr:Phage protein (N4 Gp49/phage Sf6 gene 66) family [uncultured Caudovirales phage]